MTRRSFIKGLLALPLGLALGVKAAKPLYDWKTYSATMVLEKRAQAEEYWGMPITEHLAAMQKEMNEKLKEVYFSPGPTWNNLS